MIRERQTDLRAELAQHFMIERRPFPPQLVIARQLPQLDAPQGRAQLVDAVVVSQFQHVITPGVTFVTLQGQAGHAV